MATDVADLGAADTRPTAATADEARELANASPLDLASGVRVTEWHRGRPRRTTWAALADVDWRDTAMVLGAGGSTGLAFETGVLLAMAVDHDLRAGDPAVLVGTSAGSVVSTLLGIGCEPGVIAALATESEHVGPVARRHGLRFEPASLPVPSWTAFVRMPTPVWWWQYAGLVARRRFRAAALHALPHGAYDLREQLHPLEGVTWPDPAGRLRICAVGLHDGRLEVFTGDGDVPLVDAVAASCAVPAVVRPVRHGRRLYVDGGVRSPTNADLVAGPDHPSTVVVLSPMSGRTARTATGRMSSAFSRARLAAEAQCFRSGQRVITVEPLGALSQAVVDDALDASHVARIVGSSFLAPSATVAAPPA